jgi:penicillin-insensitive murein endopeptidase
VPERAGRTHVHSKVRAVMLAAYRMLEREQPGKVFKYAETGLKDGGQFKPHKTHRNGLSVDFIVPVMDPAGASVHLPTHPFNRYGYDIEFDAKGRYGDYAIDYEALAAHIVALHKAAKQHEIGIWRVIFDPGLAPNLYETKYGAYIRKNIEIPRKNPGCATMNIIMSTSRSNAGSEELRPGSKGEPSGGEANGALVKCGVRCPSSGSI